MYSEKKNGDGAGLLNAPIVGIVIAVDLDNIENYIVYAFVKNKPGTMESRVPNRIVLSNNELSLGNINEQGTSVINGGTNVQQFMIGLGID